MSPADGRKLVQLAAQGHGAAFLARSAGISFGELNAALEQERELAEAVNAGRRRFYGGASRHGVVNVSKVWSNIDPDEAKAETDSRSYRGVGTGAWRRKLVAA